MVGMHGPWGVLDLAAYSSGVPCMGRLNVCLPLGHVGKCAIDLLCGISVGISYIMVYHMVPCEHMSPVLTLT